jgi:protein TonB
MAGSTPDVYTLHEIARAVGVPADTVRAAITSGELRPCGDRYFAERDILRLASTLRSVAVVTRPLEAPRGLFTERPVTAERRFPLVASIGAHALLLGAALWLTAGTSHTAPSPVMPEPPRLVFLSLPGVGGGGGGSGARQKAPAARIERARGLRASVSVPEAVLTKPAAEKAAEPQPTPAAITPAVVEKAPEPLPSRAVIAPIVLTASHSRDKEGVVERPAPDETVREGTGTGGRAGGGQGQGIGDGTGSGLGDGSGGGTGGGPYRAGSGIQPPRLLREVKADYTEEARRKRLSGDVVLEIVVTRDGRVGNISVLRGLGLGLDQQAIAAVRQWQFAPARRLGEPVDVIVEVAVEFKFR